MQIWNFVYSICFQQLICDETFFCYFFASRMYFISDWAFIIPTKNELDQVSSHFFIYTVVPLLTQICYTNKTIYSNKINSTIFGSLLLSLTLIRKMYTFFMEAWTLTTSTWIFYSRTSIFDISSSFRCLYYSFRWWGVWKAQKQKYTFYVTVLEN